MWMKHSWFHHTDCSTEQADELVKRYKARGVRVERNLNPDYVTGLSVPFFRPQIRQRARIAAGETGCGDEHGYLSQQTMARRRRSDRALCSLWSMGNAGGTPKRRERNGIKTDDCATAVLCVCCHDSIDNGNKLNRDERRQLMDHAIVLTVIEVTRRGLVVPA